MFQIEHNHFIVPWSVVMYYGMVIDFKLDLFGHFFSDRYQNLTLESGFIGQMDVPDLQGVSGAHCVKA